MTKSIFLFLMLLPAVGFADADFDISKIYDHEHTGCMPKEIAEGLIAKYRVDISTFGRLELCDPRHPSRLVLLSLFMMDQGRFDGLNPRDRLPQDIQTFVSSNLVAIRADWCPEHAFACAQSGSGLIKIPPAFSQPGVNSGLMANLVFSTVTMIHEAAHLDGRHHDDVCPVGLNRGERECEFFAHAGPFSLQQEYYLRVLEHGTNFHPLYKLLVFAAMGEMPSKFVDRERAFRPPQILLVEEEGNRATLWNNELGQSISLPPGSSLYGAGADSYGAFTLPTDSTPLQFLFSGLEGLKVTGHPLENEPPKIGLIERYFGFWHFLDRKEGEISPLEVFERSEGSFALYPDRMKYRVHKYDKKWMMSGLPAGETALGISDTIPCYAPEGLPYEGVFVHMQSKKIFKAFIDWNDRLLFSKELVCHWPAHLRAVNSLNGALVALDSQGRFYTWKPGNKDVREILQGEDSKRRFQKLTKVNWAFSRDSLTP